MVHGMKLYIKKYLLLSQRLLLSYPPSFLILSPSLLVHRRTSEELKKPSTIRSAVKALTPGLCYYSFCFSRPPPVPSEIPQQHILTIHRDPRWGCSQKSPAVVCGYAAVYVRAICRVEGVGCTPLRYSPANVPFLVLGNKTDIPYVASGEELRYHLGLSNFTTGSKVNLMDSNVRPLEVFMCCIVRKMGMPSSGSPSTLGRQISL